jgi:hypothetical protein
MIEIPTHFFRSDRGAVERDSPVVSFLVNDELISENGKKGKAPARDVLSPGAGQYRLKFTFT